MILVKHDIRENLNKIMWVIFMILLIVSPPKKYFVFYLLFQAVEAH